MDRFMLLYKEYPKYLRIQSRKRVMCIICGIWLYGILLGTSEVLLWDILTPHELHGYFDFSQDCHSPPKHNMVYALVLAMLSIFGPLLAVELFSFAVFIQLMRKLRRPQIHPINNITSSQNMNPSSRRPATGRSVIFAMAQRAAPPRPEADPNQRYKKAASVLGAIVLVVNICTLPYVFYVIITNFICPECINVYFENVLLYLLSFNSCINPFLYAATMNEIGNFYKRILCNLR
ncbi:lysophosphatidic acid receptor 1-A-like [Amphiura filiformis]|uniref:lysophosphatidic acid receptor 1-A-like n=1 Tax=Amphiura filiformis TaxID=82378 RepID=UPI003B22821B